jgi:hypothetical protein
MNNRSLPGYLVSILSMAFALTIPQITFSQNTSGAGVLNYAENWQFGLNSSASFGLNSKETSLFRGNGLATGLNGQYFFGPIGLGVNSGFIYSKLNTSAINQFMIDRKFPQTSTVGTTPSQNAYLLVGPSLRLGQRVQIIASVKGGMFMNQSGGLVIGQQGAVRPLYRFDAGTKSFFPGFNGSLSFSYPVGTTSAFVLTTDFLQSSSSIQLFDPQQGIDIPVEQQRKWQSINAGISFIKTFQTKAPRDAASGLPTGRRTREAGSGMATGKRSRDAASGLPTGRRGRETGSGMATGKRSRDAASGLPTGRRQYAPASFNNPEGDDETSLIDPENKRILKTKTKSNQSNDRTTTESCGPVTTKTTRPDGTVEEQTFSCPDDAVQYKTKIDGGGMPNRISMNVTVPKQTQGTTFGEKVNQGLHAAGSIVSGRIVHKAGATGAAGIVTNRTHGGGGGAAQASYAATGMAVNTGIGMNLYSREAGSGMATGKRSRDAGSGMASGRRQYQPFYSENTGFSCSTCVASVAVKPIRGWSIKTNAAAASTSKKTENGYQPWEATDGDELAQLTAVDVHLLDITTGAIVASTQTDNNGAFWFANVPSGKYIVEIDGVVQYKKGYDYYKAQSDMKTIDVAGEVLLGYDAFELVFDTPDEGKGVLKFNHNSVRSNKSTIKGDGGGGVSDSLQQKGTIVTSRQNTKGIIVVGSDIDGDGVTDRFTATAILSDGTNVPINDLVVRKQEVATEIVIPFNPPSTQKASINTTRSNIKQTSIIIGEGANNFKVTGIFSDGTTRTATQLSETVSGTGVFQVSISLGDSDGDGHPDFIWSPRSNLVVTSQSETTNRSDIPAIAFNGSSSFVKNLPLYFNTTTDTDQPVILAGNHGSTTAPGPAARPGTPIGGIIVKGGKNPGGQMFQLQTNGLGEFEFTGIKEGNYLITTEYALHIKDQTMIEVGDMNEDGPTTRAQDHNSTRSNKTANSVAPNPSGDSSNTKAQDHNSSRSNKSSSSVAPNPGGGTFTSAKTAVNSLLQTLLDAEELLNNDNASNKTGVSTSRSNIRNLQNALFDLQRALNNEQLAIIQSKAKEVDRQMQILQSTFLNLGSRYTSISNVLKTKHDTAKNSIGNIR